MEKIKIHSLSEEMKSRFRQICEKNSRLTSDPKPVDLIRESKRLSPILAKDMILLDKMRALRNGELEYVVFDNIPIDSILCEPPEDGLRPSAKVFWTSELALLSITQLANLIPLSYYEEKGNDLIHQVAPSKRNYFTRSNEGIIELGPHTDNSILDKQYRPDFLALLALINDPGTDTRVSSVIKAFDQLSIKHQKTLQEPLYRIQSPDSFDRAFKNKKILSEYRAIVTTDQKGRLSAAGNVYGVQAKDESAKIALAAFGEALIDVSDSIVLQPGMLLIFSNSTLFHSRGKIENGKRWIQRIFLKSDLSDIRKATRKSTKDYIFPVHNILI